MSIPTHVLLVDDDADLCKLLERFFTSHGYGFSALHSAVDLERALQTVNPSIVVLDLMLPQVDGLTALTRLRVHDQTTPVIMLTARAEDVDRIIGLELGADDYIGKPFMPRELLSRINAVLRHTRRLPVKPAPTTRSSITFGRFELIPASRTLLRDGSEVRIGARELSLLEILASRPMEALSRDELVERLEGSEGTLSETTVYVSVMRLRRIVEDDPQCPRFIQTIRGTGYIFVPEGRSDEATI